jgi:hypothetical protein
MSSSQFNTDAYTNAISQAGGRRRKRSKMNRRSRSYRRNQNQNQSENQNGGFFPGVGEVLAQAVVPFGLYAAQHKFKSSNKFRNPSKYSFKKFRKFKFTRKL